MKVKRERYLITVDEPKSIISEQYRNIRTNLQFFDIDQRLKTIVLSSPNPSEGKSTTISNLAVVFAQQGNRVLLVDADLRKPTLHYIFNQGNVCGLTTVLTKQASYGDCINKEVIHNLDVLTSGPIPPNPSELLGSYQMMEFMNNVSKHYDYIFFDVPPILAVTDAIVLSNICSGLALVVSSGQTEKAALKLCETHLDVIKTKFLGVILNKTPQEHNRYHYYYGK